MPSKIETRAGSSSIKTWKIPDLIKQLLAYYIHKFIVQNLRQDACLQLYFEMKSLFSQSQYGFRYHRNGVEYQEELHSMSQKRGK